MFIVISIEQRVGYPVPRVVNEVLRDAPLGHLVLDVAERGLVLAEVVGHVAVGVDGEQVGAGVDEEL